ncbi:ATP-binding cassette sub-family G member 1 [Halotydeus destructor]|nr:ATP-binding cassette sub-family G member 1 [Halotydeus destructor]
MCDVVTISAAPTVAPSDVALLWKNLSVYDPNSRRTLGCMPFSPGSRDKERRILKGLNGVIYRKSLNAIMGPSGAGKTTLLKCLFGTSSIRYSGQLFVGDKDTRAVFITQNEEDHLLLNLTVEESIQFAARVKNSGHGGPGSCRGCMGKCTVIATDLVNGLIDQLDLDRCRHTLVRKCSGGQKKRLAIAQELASFEKPKIIFMDEPTSGIDSSVSYLVLRQLQTLSQRSGIAIVATIHQPSYKILELFDQLYILSRRGKAIYQGRPQYLRPHLLRYSLGCPDGHNPADVIIELASTITRKESDKEEVIGHAVLPVVAVIGRASSKVRREMSPIVVPPSSEVQRIETLEKVAEIECEEKVSAIYHEYLHEVRKLCSQQVARSFLHIWFLFKRCLVNSVLREPRWLIIRIILHLLVAIILSFLYDGAIGQEAACLDTTTPEYDCRCSPQLTLDGLRKSKTSSKNVSFLFFNLLFLMFAAIMPTILTFPAEMKVFLNEHRNGWYNTRSYYYAKSFVEFLVQLPIPYVYSLFIYRWTKQPGLESLADMVPFYGSSRFKTFSGVMLLATYISQGVGFLIGAIFAKNFNISIFVATIFMLFNFLFAGFFIRIADMGSVEFLTKLSFIRFSFEAILLTVYGEGRCGPTLPSETSVASQLAALFARPTSTVAPFMAQDNVTQSAMGQLLTFKSTVLYQFNLDEGQDYIFSRALMWLLIHFFLWRVLTFFCLMWKVSTESMARKMFWPYYLFKGCCKRRNFISFLIGLLITLAVLGCLLLILYLV